MNLRTSFQQTYTYYKHSIMTIITDIHMRRQIILKKDIISCNIYLFFRLIKVTNIAIVSIVEIGFHDA